MKLFVVCGISYIAAVAIIYCAYIGELKGVAVLTSVLAYYASRGYWKGGKWEE